MPPTPPTPKPPPSERGFPGSEYVSAGTLIILVIAVLSTVLVMSLPIPHRDGLEFWTFTRNHARIYTPLIGQWDERVAQTGEGQRVNLFTLESLAMQRRVLNGFWAGTPLADLLEVESGWFYKTVAGPIEDVGFTDLTDRLRAEGIDARINPPSFSPWTSRGRIFGLPHDVHPVLLAYRSDIVEDELGIDVSQIKTWDDFARVMRAVSKDMDDDGRSDRYALNFWFNDADALEVLMLQAGGGTFDTDDRIIVSCEANAKVLATAVHWCFGPGRIAISAPDFDAGGNQLRLDGKVVCALMPDWLAGVWKNDLPQLGGKIKLMPLPAWEPGGRRTSVRGGTMLGIPKATDSFEDAWALAKYLYLSKEVARQLFEGNNIISPVMTYWDEDFYHQPDPFFGGQASGTLFIEQAPNVPLRPSHPYRVIARAEIGQVANELRDFADAKNDYTVATLLPEARRLLGEAQQRVLKQMERNVFLRSDTGSGSGSGADADADAGEVSP